VYILTYLLTCRLQIPRFQVLYEHVFSFTYFSENEGFLAPTHPNSTVCLIKSKSNRPRRQQYCGTHGPWGCLSIWRSSLWTFGLFAPADMNYTARTSSRIKMTCGRDAGLGRAGRLQQLRRSNDDAAVRRRPLSWHLSRRSRRLRSITEVARPGG